MMKLDAHRRLPTRESNERTRWLLPFTYRINREALDLVCQMAQEADATLVAISLLAPGPGKGIQIEEIQQSKDFLELVHYRQGKTKYCATFWPIFRPDTPSMRFN
jgi:hypothetical protein